MTLSENAAGGANGLVRVGLILNSDVIEPWQAAIVDEVDHEPAYELVRVYRLPAADHSAGRESIISVINRIEGIVARRLFRWIFRNKRRAGEQSVPLGERLPGVHVERMPEAPDAFVEATDGLDLDVVVDLTTSSVGDGLRSKARLGVWSLDIGRRLNATQPFLAAGLREVCEGNPTTQVSLRSVTHDGEWSTLVTGAYRTFLWSWHENVRQLQFKAGVMIIDALSAAARGELGVARSHEEQSPAENGARSMTAAGLTLGLFKCWWRIGSETIERAFREEKWQLYVAPLKSGAPTPVGSDLSQALVMETPRHSYWADPFPIERDGRRCVFFEEYPYATRKGIISVADYDVQGSKVSVGPARMVIEQDTHMSYPFLFELGDDLYMIPETSAERTIGLWRCSTFPGAWHKVRNLMEGVSATDTTLIEHGGRWWMFTNIDRSGLGDHCSELHVFHSDDPIMGEWTAHTMNPVVRDSRSARMAGPLTWSNEDGLIRPAQVNDDYYGHAVSLQCVTRLSPDVYEEECTRRIDADWHPGIYRNHHIAPIGDSVLIDACRNQFKFPRIWNNWKARLRVGRRRHTGSQNRSISKLTTTA